MKQIFLLLTAFTVSLSMIAQGNSAGKGKDKQKDKTENPGNSKDKEKADKEKKELSDHNKKIWEGTSDNGAGSKPSKNQPAKVRSSFQRDYPNATNVYWTKYRGDWTATFGNGIWRSTAIYHANGERRDTRTPVAQENIPRKILDVILKRKPNTNTEEAVKIEVPKTNSIIYKIKEILNGKSNFQFYNADGLVVQYNY
jgi:hypothetical protein